MIPGNYAESSSAKAAAARQSLQLSAPAPSTQLPPAAPPSRGPREVTLWENPLGAVDKFTLIVSFFASEHPHTPEVAAAIRANLANPLISRVLLLLERMKCAEARMTLATVEATGGNAGKIACVTVSHQPTYADFFEMAHRLPPLPATPTASGGRRRASRQLVIVSNADVVFDESLGNINGQELRQRKKIAVMGVTAHLADSGRYSRSLGRPVDAACPSITERCDLNPQMLRGYGSSWDVYAFGAPLWGQGPGATDLAGQPLAGAVSPPIFRGAPEDMDFPMNLRGAEQRCSRAMHRAGLRFTNLCRYVKAEHWHCEQKMRPNNTRVNLASFKVQPCFHESRRGCDGLLMPRVREAWVDKRRGGNP